MTMNAMMRDVATDLIVPARDTRAPEPGAGRRATRWGAVVAMALALVCGVALFTLGQRAAIDDAPETLPASGVAAPVEGIATMPSAPVDGVLTMVIPPGAAADQQAGGRGYVMPSVIDLKVGDTIVIRNDDNAPHMILYTFLLPGETDERTFNEPGSEVYSSGCGLHAASILNFTTIFVSEPGAGDPAA